MRKEEALQIIQEQIDSVQQRYAQQRITNTQRELMTRVLNLTAERIKEITEI
jgi:CBS domain containing-hemolysin-like protein